MSKKYRGVVIGCGRIGALLEDDPQRPKPATHAGAFAAHKKVDLVALVDRDRRRLNAALRKYPKARGYSDIKACFKVERPDIVAIATEPSSRFPIVRACVSAKVPMIICEKPLAHGAQEARKIQKIVEKSGATFVVNYQRRFYPLIVNVRDSIKAGKIGRIQHVSCFYSNGLYNNGGHLIDALHFLTGDRIIAAHGFVNPKNTTHPKGDMNIDCLLSTARGTIISMQSFDQRAYGASEIRVFGERGAFFIREYGFTVVRVFVKPSVFKDLRQLDYIGARTTTNMQSAVSGALDHVIECHEHGKKSRSSAASAYEAVRVLDMVKTSAKPRTPRIQS